jgi:hypothetical protein
MGRLLGVEGDGSPKIPSKSHRPAAGATACRILIRGAQALPVSRAGAPIPCKAEARAPKRVSGQRTDLGRGLCWNVNPGGRLSLRPSPSVPSEQLSNLSRHAASQASRVAGSQASM